MSTQKLAEKIAVEYYQWKYMKNDAFISNGFHLTNPDYLEIKKIAQSILDDHIGGEPYGYLSENGDFIYVDDNLRKAEWENAGFNIIPLYTKPQLKEKKGWHDVEEFYRDEEQDDE